MAKFYGVAALVLYFFTANAQNDTKSFTVRYTEGTIKPDGILDEPIWNDADSAADFHQYFPSDSAMAIQPTEIKMLYNDKTLFIGIKANADGPNYNTRSLQRDFRGPGIDQITLVFDTFNDGNTAFLFGINPFGVRREGLIANGGLDGRDFTTSWDVKWRGDAKIHDKYFTAELAIPLTSLKFKEGETKFRFNSYRLDMQTNERTTWMDIPQNQPIL